MVGRVHGVRVLHADFGRAAGLGSADREAAPAAGLRRRPDGPAPSGPGLVHDHNGGRVPGSARRPVQR